mmetsp:Transcript_23606/g.54976  ORF Transcript_23606/g.54976 Transcript_23606/m.54976 type:complete len:331 (+) Transcript_23606:110-1102(+)
MSPREIGAHRRAEGAPAPGSQMGQRRLSHCRMRKQSLLCLAAALCAWRAFSLAFLFPRLDRLPRLHESHADEAHHREHRVPPDAGTQVSLSSARVRLWPFAAAASAALVAPDVTVRQSRVHLTGRSAAAEEEDDEDVELYFGVGDFRRLQHEFVLKEALSLGRRGFDITAMTGYAGSTQVLKNDKLCGGDANKFGHAKVVQLTLPPASVPEFAKLFFEEVRKRDPKDFDSRGQFARPVIGLERGMSSPLMAEIEKAAGGAYSFEKGIGADPDFPAGAQKVYVYDARKFRFRPAELNNQFVKASPKDSYTSDYLLLNQVQSFIGRISFTNC